MKYDYIDRIYSVWAFSGATIPQRVVAIKPHRSHDVDSEYQQRLFTGPYSQVPAKYKVSNRF